MASFFSRLNPVHAFPPYRGPYSVGSIEVEIPVSDLASPSTTPPSPDANITTLQFRVFYPCEKKPPKSTAVYWIPSPQRSYLSAYARFLGASPTLAQLSSYLPNILQYITIPVSNSAPLLQPPETQSRWPVLVFSHGLGGSRNAYSHLCGSLASHGLVVLAPEHRDGSCPVTHISATASSPARTVDYRHLAHARTKEVEDGRNEQLEVRLWELGLVHAALLKLDSGEFPTEELLPSGGASPKSLKDAAAVLARFRDSLVVREPGSIAWAGHSFGAATMVQFVKSVFYSAAGTAASSSNDNNETTTLYKPPPASPLTKQITCTTPVILLDLWCLPLLAPSTKHLWKKPMPCYSTPPSLGQQYQQQQQQKQQQPGGDVLLAILSEAFYKWTQNLKYTQRVLSPPSSSSSSSSTTTSATSSPSHSFNPPHIFYPATSAHLSQSDFGVLFPWATKRFFHADEPERTLWLNTRAILQVLRLSGMRVADVDVDVEADRVVDIDVDVEVGVEVEKKENDTQHRSEAEAAAVLASTTPTTADEKETETETETDFVLVKPSPPPPDPSQNTPLPSSSSSSSLHHHHNQHDHTILSLSPKTIRGWIPVPIPLSSTTSPSPSASPSPSHSPTDAAVAEDTNFHTNTSASVSPSQDNDDNETAYLPPSDVVVANEVRG
ncbi:MAG: hypothetical protein M1819_000668 [Sarea resinae]|nr:MAG: hypothetical protein M1819_000668 [Sarea resinae]